MNTASIKHLGCSSRVAKLKPGPMGLRYNAAGIGLTALLMLATAVPAAAAIGREEIGDLAARIQYAWYTQDLKQLVELADELGREKGRGELDRWVRYYSAYGYFRAAELADDEYLDAFVGRCEAKLRPDLRAGTDFTEAFVLAGACSSLLAARRPIAAVFAPSRAVRAFRKAEHLDPDNPRLRLQQATGALGRLALADEFPAPLVLVDQAIALFARPLGYGDLQPTWGEAEAHLLRARIALDAGEKVQARDSAEFALQLVPDFVEARKLMASLRTE